MIAMTKRTTVHCRRLLAVAILLPALLCGCDSSPAAAPATPATPAKSEEAVQTRGLDAETLARTIAAAQRLPRLRSLLVLRDGETLAAHRFNGGPPLDQPVNVKSASKSVLSALVGIAIQRGVLTGVDQPILSVLKADAPALPEPLLAQVTVGNLLSMQAGLERTSGENYGRWVSSPNWVRFALSRRFVDRPGGAMLYSTGNTHLLSAMLTRASGRSTHRLMQDWLGEPLGITIPPWPRDPQGIYFGGNDMLLSPRALARFGELYRSGGKIDGRRIVPAAWIEDSWTPRTVSPWSGGQYGLGWFIGEAGGHPLRFAWGYGGQMLYIVPDLRLTVVMTSAADAPRESGHIQALHDLVANGLIPAAELGAGRQPASGGLSSRPPADVRR
jgi:CubicO group peptidase (beta-lactamase class C family)